MIVSSSLSPLARPITTSAVTARLQIAFALRFAGGSGTSGAATRAIPSLSSRCTIFATSASQSPSRSLSAFSSARGASSFGRSDAAGICAFSSSNGMMAAPSRKASAISRRIGSSGLSSRRLLPLSRTSLQSLPISTSSAVSRSISFSTYCFHETPPSMLSVSRIT